MINRIQGAAATVGPYSPAVEVNGFLFLSGQIALSPESGELVGGDVAAQTEQIVRNIKAILDAAGSDISKVVKTTCFLKDIRDFAAFNEVYARHFTTKPARSCVEVAAIPKGALAEIEVVAVK